MKKILFPTDFSNNAKNSFKYALNLSKYLNTSITSMHVQNGERSWYDAYLTESIMPGFKKRMSTDYELFLMEAQKNRDMATGISAPNIELNYALREGNLVDEILKIADEDENDLIIMGTTNENDFRKSLLGSNTIRVIKKSKKPVLVVPENVPFKEVKKIAFALPLDQWEEEVILKAEAFARELDAKLFCFSVIEPIEFDKLDEQKKKMDIYKFEFRNYPNVQFDIVENYSLFGGINEYISQHEVELLGVHYVKKGKIQHFFGGNNVENITLATELPLLILK